MKRSLLTLLAILVILGLFALTGYAGYRLGSDEGAQASANDNGRLVRPFDRFERPRMDEFGWGHNFNRDRASRVFFISGFRSLSPLLYLGFLTTLALTLGFFYWLFTRNNQQFARTTQATETPPPPPTETEKQE